MNASPAALRAAERIRKKLNRVNPEWCMSVEQIIEEEFATDRAELIAALRALVNFYEHAIPNGKWSRTPMWGIVTDARAALAKYSKP